MQEARVLSTNHVRYHLERAGLTPEHFEQISNAVASGYGFVRKLIEEVPMLGRSAPGFYNTGNLRNIAVQYALESVAAESELFFTEPRLNNGKNYVYTVLSAHGVSFTSHYAGREGTEGVQKALYRGELAQRNSDLFEADGALPDLDIDLKPKYVQLIHAGNLKPLWAMIRIPDRNQVTASLEPFVLDLPSADMEQVERIEDKVKSRFDLIVPQEDKNETGNSTE